MDEILQAIAELFYASGKGATQVTLTEVLRNLAQFEDGHVEEAIQVLERQSLLRRSLQHPDVLISTLAGKESFERRCVSELCLGQGYIAQKYAPAVVHIVVRKANGDESGGTGFFVDDFPGFIATAKHVVEGNVIAAIYNKDGEPVLWEQQGAMFVEEGEDVALFRSPIADGVIPLRIEWARTEISELDNVLVLGYPPIAQHQPALVHARGEIAALPLRQDGKERSIVISRITEPGYSGGPVINSRGFVIGIVEQENQLQRLDGNPSIFVTAAFALHLRKIAL